MFHFRTIYFFQCGCLTSGSLHHALTAISVCDSNLPVCCFFTTWYLWAVSLMLDIYQVFSLIKMTLNPSQGNNVFIVVLLACFWCYLTGAEGVGRSKARLSGGCLLESGEERRMSFKVRPNKHLSPSASPSFSLPFSSRSQPAGAM